jgi:quinoprotein glucose dehydrogenase
VIRSQVGAGGLALALALSLACGDDAPPTAPGGPVAGWPAWGGDPGGSRFSPLTQIDPANVRFLERAWAYRTGDRPDDAPEGKLAFQATPVLADGVLYGCTPRSRAFAVDAETGVERWRFDPEADLTGTYIPTCRGVALWREELEADGACARRVFLGTMDARLIALDAATGLPCPGFGREGSVDLRDGLGEVLPGETYPTSPPAVVGDVVAIGGLVRDASRLDAPGGVVRGFDARTGALRWAFDGAPPGASPLSLDGARYRRGTPNAWAPFSADPARNLLFVPTGNPSPDFYGGLRDGIDHYGTSVVALDAATGRVRWHFQTVHHDLWDYDVASQPTLLDLEIDGATVPALLQPTKMGHVFLLHRETGVPLHPVEERPVPASDVAGEQAAPTQPFPTFPPPLVQRITPAQAFGLTPWDRAICRGRLEALRDEGMFTPPSVQGTLLHPGTAGGANWGGVAWDPGRKLAVVNLNRVAQSITLVPRDVPDDGQPSRRERIVFPQDGTPFRAILAVVLSPFGIPCGPPPWGTLAAIDLASGGVRWEVPFGTTRDMTPFGVAIPFGLPSMGGPIVTASGLVFIGAALDDYLRAYDVETGEELWRARLPAGGQATPMTYRLGPDRRQYVVIAAGGHGTLGTRQGDWLIAYALPER